MLVATELVRDVLCIETIELSKCIDQLPEEQAVLLRPHIGNITKILLSPKDFVSVPQESFERIRSYAEQ